MDRTFTDTPPPGFADLGLQAAPLDESRTSYDDLGRPTATSVFHNGAIAEGDDGRGIATTTVYTAAGTRVAEPAQGPGIGSVATTVSRVDARGNTSHTYRFEDDPSLPANYLLSWAQFSPRGERTRSTTPAGVVTTAAYDWLGQSTASTDPDAGPTTASYDANGNLATSTDGKGQVLAYSYDDLDRRTAIRDGSTSGPVLASWTYDTGTANKGRLMADTGWDRVASPARAATRTYSYDARSRLTGVTVDPDDTVGFGTNTFTTSYGYDEADHPTAVTYPAIGTIPAETVTAAYTGIGVPTTLTGVLTPSGTVTPYVADTDFNATGNLASRRYTPAGGDYTRAYDYMPGTRKLKTMQMAPTATPSSKIQDDRIVWAANGDILRTSDSVAGESVCSEYDTYHRLTRAYSRPGTGVCSTSGAGTGPHPMDLTYDYSPDGQITKAIDAVSSTTTTYATRAASGALPHLPASIKVGGAAAQPVAADTNGQVTALGAASSHTWDKLRRLASTTTSSATTKSGYDASGMRILRDQTSGGTTQTTLYLPDQELTVNQLNQVVIGATRYIKHGATTVATRTGPNTADVRIVVADHQTTAQLAINPTDGTITRRWQTPYGDQRATTGPALPGQRRFLNHVQDESGLIDDAHRAYSPKHGLFLSTDPLAAIAPVTASSPYGYSAANPITWSDPSGLVPVGAGDTATTSDIQAYKDSGAAAPRNVKKAPTATKRQQRFDQGTKFIAKEMVRNSEGKYVRDTRKAFDDLENPGAWESLIYGTAQEEILIALLLSWRDQVCSGCAWDHKTEIASLFGARGYQDAYMPVPFHPDWEISHDVLSNIHYAYVGREAGFDAVTLKQGSRLQGITEGAVDPGDEVSVEIGIRLHEQVRPQDLRPGDVYWAIIGAFPDYLQAEVSGSTVIRPIGSAP